MATKTTSNPFCARHVYKGRTYQQEYVRYYDREVIADAEKFDSKHPDQFLIKKVSTEYERVPIKDYVNQFASKVGILNELRGVISKQQMDDYIETHQAQPGFTDLTKLPDSAFEISKLAEQVDRAWESVPVELRGKLTKEEFMKTLTSEKIKSYIVSQATIEKKEEK